MKKIYSIIAVTLLTVSVFAQAPQSMSYQAVIRDAGNALVTNQSVGMQISILQGSATGASIYVETQTPTSNINGLVSLEIGNGTPVSGAFNTINWASGPYFIKTETDPTGGTTYTITGTTQLMSVPYALHAKTAENVMNDLVDDADADPTNEMNTGVVLNGTDLEVTDGNGTIITDLSSLQDGVNDADADSTNEIQNLSSVLTENNDAGNSQIKNLANPTVAQDAATKAYVDLLEARLDALEIRVQNLEPAQIGDFRAGGVVFWVDPLDDTHGLVCAVSDQSVGIQWYNGVNIATGATGTLIGTGQINTAAIIASQGSGSYAAQVCDDLIMNGYSDWFLPSQGELDMMYQNKVMINATAIANGGSALLNNAYWCSTEANTSQAFIVNITNGFTTTFSKANTNYVRAIREF